MGLFDKLTGTQHPPLGVSPVPGEELRAALLDLNQPDVPFVVRYGGGEQCDLLAEWRLTDPAWQQVFVQSQISHTVRIRMRLVHKDHEVRVLEEQWQVSRVGTPTRLEVSSEYTRGPSRTVSREWTFGRGESGRLEATETFRFDSAQLRDPLRNTVLTSGWTWRGVVFGKL
ncbi:hypothetical protein ABZ484_28365 [Streptomyces sp. NPDC006393]|uniref:hypothetical protein n=1 Tax=Streptomyces sp. NPDC006393 TaxID=3156763 RepID=UPI0034031BFE